MKDQSANLARNVDYHHGDLKKALVAAAAQVLRTAEIGELSLRELANALGVSTAAPYSHFKDKEHLLNAVADEGFRLLHECLSGTMARRLVGDKQLIAIIKAYLAWSHEQAGFYKVMFQSPSSRKHQADEGIGFAYQTLGILLHVVQGVAPNRLTPKIGRERAIMLCSLLHGIMALDNAGPFKKLSNTAVLTRLAVEAGSKMLSHPNSPPEAASWP